MIIDMHCHYTLSRQSSITDDRFSFESPAPVPSNGAAPLPTAYDSCIADRALNRLDWKLARVVGRLPAPGPALDAYLSREYDAHLAPPGPVERFVLLAFDAVHDDNGRVLPLPRRGSDRGNDIYTSNSLIRAKCRGHPDRWLFGASVHPYRADAVALVEEVFAAGACLLKWIPQHHNINPCDPRTLDVLRTCARLGLPVLVHIGEEFALATQFRAWRPIDPLLEALRSLRREDAMPCTIVAHVATPVTPWGDRRSHRLLLEALRGDLADAPLYADISALTSWAKVGYLRRLAADHTLHHKLLYGSDFPIPLAMPRLRRDLGREYRRIAAIRSWPQRTAAIARHVGFEEIVLQRAAELLPHTGGGTLAAAAQTA